MVQYLAIIYVQHVWTSPFKQTHQERMGDFLNVYLVSTVVFRSVTLFYLLRMQNHVLLCNLYYVVFLKNPEFNQDFLANSFLNPKICALYSNSENPEIENNTRHNLIWLFIFYIAEMLYIDLKCILI